MGYCSFLSRCLAHQPGRRRPNFRSLGHCVRRRFPTTSQETRSWIGGRPVPADIGLRRNQSSFTSERRSGARGTLINPSNPTTWNKHELVICRREIWKERQRESRVIRNSKYLSGRRDYGKTGQENERTMPQIAALFAAEGQVGRN